MARSAKVVKKQARSQVKAQREGLSDELKRRLREAGALLLLPLALYLLVCLLSYNDQDPSWGHMGIAERATNFGGSVGANIANLLRYIFGLVSYCFPLLLLALGVQVLRARGERLVAPWEPSLRLIGFVFFFRSNGLRAPSMLAVVINSGAGPYTIRPSQEAGPIAERELASLKDIFSRNGNDPQCRLMRQLLVGDQADGTALKLSAFPRQLGRLRKH